jgi:uncharacterized repeat protein (TIGR03803 family)
VNGMLYGTTLRGGSYGDGTVYSISTAGTEQVLHSFGKGTDGRSPQASLIAVNGTLYGTTSRGGAHASNADISGGTVFSVDIATGKERVLHSFSGSETIGSSDGTYPLVGLIALKGVLYGTTAFGGSNSGSCFSFGSQPTTTYGTVFSLAV